MISEESGVRDHIWRLHSIVRGLEEMQPMKDAVKCLNRDGLLVMKEVTELFSDGGGALLEVLLMRCRHRES